MTNHSVDICEIPRISRYSLATFWVGTLSIFLFAAFPYTNLIGGIVTIILAVIGKKDAKNQLDKALLIIGLVFGIVAACLFWMTPGFFHTVWGIWI